MRVVIGVLLAIFGAVVQGAAPDEADEVLTQLSKIRLDKKQIYNIRDITIRRDVLTISLNRGAIAFLEPVKGKVTGAVFIGNGEIVAIPPNPIERQQISRFTGTPILNESFQMAVFRFTDATYDDIRKEISQQAQEEVSAEDAAQFDSWDMSLAGRSTTLNPRILADLLESTTKPFFLGELDGEKRGWFSVLFDLRSIEEVSIFQIRQIGPATFGDVWASFNQRSEARNLEASAHENKSPIEILSYEIEGTNGLGNNIEAKATMRIKSRVEGARVLNFELSPSLRVSSGQTDGDEAVSYRQQADASVLTVVLPRPLKLSQELTLRFAYTGEVTAQGAWYPSQRQETTPSFKSNLALAAGRSVPTLEYLGHNITPASYHDLWLVEGLARYLPVMSRAATEGGTPLRSLLSDARDELKPIEKAGPIWLGQRLASTLTPNAYRAVYGKGVWVIHMLRMMMRQNGTNPDAKFLSMLQEFAEMYDGRAASTWDFQHVAEKYAGSKLDWFFEQWIFGIGLPSYSADYKIEGSGNDFSIEGTLTQTGVPDGFVMPVPVYADGEYLGTVQVGESEGQFKFRLNKKPERILIDPEMTVLTGTSQ